MGAGFRATRIIIRVPATGTHGVVMRTRMALNLGALAALAAEAAGVAGLVGFAGIAQAERVGHRVRTGVLPVLALGGLAFLHLTLGIAGAVRSAASLADVRRLRSHVAHLDGHSAVNFLALLLFSHGYLHRLGLQNRASRGNGRAGNLLGLRIGRERHRQQRHYHAQRQQGR